MAHDAKTEQRESSQPRLHHWQELLACPECRGSLNWGDREITCTECRATYTIVDGIPILLPDYSTCDDNSSAHKQQQAAFFDSEDDDYEISRPHGTPRFYQWLFEQKFRRSVRGLPNGIRGKTALTVCGGSGMDAEFLAREGAAVIASDLSLGAARRTRERARGYGLAITPIVADAERLPFRERSVALVLVHDGLHHLECPADGLREMARVAAEAVSVTEPARAIATEIAIRFGISQRVEDAGNRVERLDVEDIAAVLRAEGYDIAHAERYAMFYRHRPGVVMTILSAPGIFTLARIGWRLANGVLGRIGNKLAVVGAR